MMKLIAIVCLALVPIAIGPITIIMAQYQNIANQPYQSMLRQQQQQQQTFGNQFQGASFSDAANFPYPQQQQQQQQQQHQHSLNQFMNQPPRQQQITFNSLSSNMSPSPPPITAHTVPNTLRSQQPVNIQLPIITAPQGAQITLNKYLPHNNNNNNNNINNLGNINNNNQQSHLLAQNQNNNLNKNQHGYIPINTYHQQQQQQLSTANNRASPSVNNRPNISPSNSNNLLQHQHMPPPRVSPPQPPSPPPQLMNNANDDQRIWNNVNSNRLSPIQATNNNNNQDVSVQNNNMRPLYQPNAIQQSSSSTTLVPFNQQQQQNHSITRSENPVTTTSMVPQSTTPTTSNNNSVMKISDENVLPPEKKQTMTEQRQQSTNSSHSSDSSMIPAMTDDTSTRRNDPVMTFDSSDSPPTTTITIDKDKYNKDKETVSYNNKTSTSNRLSNTVLESSMPTLESTVASSSITPWIEQSSQSAGPSQTSQSQSAPSSSMFATPMPTNTIKQTDISATNWYPLDQSSQIGVSRSKSQSSSSIEGGVTLQPAPEILTMPPNYNPDVRNQSSYEIVVSQQMGAPNNVDQQSFFIGASSNETTPIKKKGEVSEAEQPNESLDIATLVKPSPSFIQPTSTTTIIWSSTNSPISTARPSLVPSATVRSEVHLPSSKIIDDAPVVYGKALSQARPTAPLGTLGQNINPGMKNLRPSPVTGQANIETSVPGLGKPFIEPVEMDEVKPFASQHSGRNPMGTNNHGIRHLTPPVRSGAGPVMQIGSGLTVTAPANDTKPNSGYRNVLSGQQHSDGTNHHYANSNFARPPVNAISSSFQVSNSANEEAKNSGDGIGEMNSFDLNVDSSNDASTHSASVPINNIANTSNHVVIRRPPFRPRPLMPTRIDTCVPNDDSSCEKTHNERCIVEFGSSLCHCKPGYARTSTLRGPCILSVSYGVTLRADRISEKKLVFNSSLADINSTEYQYLEYESLQAVGTAFQSIKSLARLFMGAKVNNFTQNSKGKVLIHMTVNLESNKQTKALPGISRIIQDEMMKVAETRQRNLGESSLWLDNGSEAVSSLHDINECANRDLNDCSKYAICSNEIGSFQCECLPGYEDKSQGDSGRICLGCGPKDCSGRGDCYIIDGQKQCKCRGNFVGTRCDIDGEVMAVAVGGSLTALIIFIITFWCLYVYNQRWKQEQQKIDAMSATSGLTFSYVNSSTNNLISSAYNHHQDQGMVTSASSASNGGLSGRSMNLSSSSHQTSPSNQSFSGGIVGIANTANVPIYNGGHTMRGGANGNYTLSGHHLHGYGAGGTTKSNYVAQMHASQSGPNNYRTLVCDPRVGTQIYGVSQEAMNNQLTSVKHEKSRMGNCYYLSPEMLVNQQQQQHHHLYSSPQQRMLGNHSPTFDASQYMADDRELCIDTSGASVGHGGGGPAKRGGVPRNQSYHQQNLVFNQQQGGHHNQGRQGATLKSKSRSSQALNASDRMGYNQMAVNGGIYNETEFSSRDMYIPQYLMSE